MYIYIYIMIIIIIIIIYMYNSPACSDALTLSSAQVEHVLAPSVQSIGRPTFEGLRTKPPLRLQVAQLRAELAMSRASEAGLIWDIMRSTR